MDIKIFSDLIDALSKVTYALKAAAALPKAEREQYRQVVGQSYQLLDTTLGMIAIRLGDILLPASQPTFIDEVAKLDNCPEWIRIEREFRMCLSLRAALSEINHFSGKLKAQVSVHDIDALIEMMERTTATEGDIAGFISERFRGLASEACTPGVDIAKLRGEVTSFREALLSERRRLIRAEADLYEIA